MNSFDAGFDMSYVLYDLCRPRFKKNGGAPNRKGEVEIYCPLREDKTFEVNVRSENWNCFRKCSDCPCHGSGGILDLYILFFSGTRTRKDAYAAISETISGNPETARRRKAQKLPEIKETKKASPDVLNRTYEKFLDTLELSSVHQKMLLDRGLSLNDIERMKFRSVPQMGIASIPKMLEESGISMEGVPGFYREGKNPRINVFGSGVFIPYRDLEGNILGLQIRYDIEFRADMAPELVKALKQKRYRWFTSSDRDGGCSASNIPFWGIPGRELSRQTLYVTEGGLKAAVAQSLSGGSFVAIPGVTCMQAWESILKTAQKMGVKQLVDAFDSDRATNKNVAEAIQRLHDTARNYGYEMKSWDWGTEYKGVDDYLLAKKHWRELKQKIKAKEASCVK